jgi:hypothetical protein
MSKPLTIAVSVAFALSMAACSSLSRTYETNSGSTGASGDVVAVPDPAGTANSGTGSSSTLGQSNREAFVAGEGLD